MGQTVSAAIERLESYKNRLQAAQNKAARLEAQIEAIRARHEEAVKEALDRYGTADLDELRALYLKQEEENKRLLDEFIKAVEAYEERLALIERALTDEDVLKRLLAEQSRTPAQTAGLFGADDDEPDF